MNFISPPHRYLSRRGAIYVSKPSPINGTLIRCRKNLERWNSLTAPYTTHRYSSSERRTLRTRIHWYSNFSRSMSQARKHRPCQEKKSNISDKMYSMEQRTQNLAKVRQPTSSWLLLGRPSSVSCRGLASEGGAPTRQKFWGGGQVLGKIFSLAPSALAGLF